jgi:CheY-like chemotaxis protein/GAF domain-containing protein
VSNGQILRKGAGGGDALLVLLVDDDPDLIGVTQSFLEGAGFKVLAASNGERALHAVQFVRPDVIVLEMMMPVMDGFGFLREYARRHPEGERAPVLATSTFAPYVDRAEECGAAAALPKPYEPQELIDVIQRLANGEEPTVHSPAVLPPEEDARRLRAVLHLGLDKPAPEVGLDDFVRGVAMHFGVAMCLVSVITEDRQFWTAAWGLPPDLDETRSAPRHESFCTHAVAARAALVVQDTAESPFFNDNAFVRDYGVRFYAGVPLVARHGEALGTLCLLDFAPRIFRYTDLELLGVFGRRVLAVIEQREKRETRGLPDSVFRYLQYVDEELDVFGQLSFRELAVVEAARGLEQGHRVACVVVAAPYRRLAELSRALRARSDRGMVGRLGHARLGWIVTGMSAESALAIALEEAGPHAFAEADELQRYPGAALAALDFMEASLGDAGLA